MFRSGWLAVLGVVFCGSVQAVDVDVSSDEAILRGVRVATDGPGLLEFFQQRSPSEANAAKIEPLIDKLASGKFREREKAVADLLRIGVAARPYLVKVQQHKDIEVRRRVEECLAIIDKVNTPEIEGAAVRVLRARRPAGSCAALLDVLPAIRDGGVEEEIQAALLDLGIKDGKADESLVQALADKSAARRAAAVVVLGRSGNQQQREQVRKLMQTETEMLVKLRAAQGLIAGKDTKAVAALLPLLTEAPLNLAEQAHDLLIAVAADKGPSLSLADNRLKCRQEWEAWWKDNEKKVVLGREEVDLPWLNSEKRAAKLAVAFLDAFVKGDVAALKKMIDVPFNFAGEFSENRAVVEKALSKYTDGNDRKMAFDFSKPRFLPVDEFGRKLKKEMARTFLNKVPKSELRVAYIVASSKTETRRLPVVVILRVRGGQVRVIGCDDARE